jgi:hypothetical protein
MLLHPGGTIVAKDAEAKAKNIRITAEAYHKLAVAAAMVGETKSTFASRAILEAAGRVLPPGWPELGGGGPPGPRRKK